MTKSITGTVRMSDGTRRPARKTADGVIEFSTFGNANSSRGTAYRKASAKQAETFVPDVDETPESPVEATEALDPTEDTDADVQHDPTHAEALELNTQVVYVYGHGTRVYELTGVVMYDNGDFLYTVRPLSGGMEWSFDRRPFGTVPFEI